MMPAMARPRAAAAPAGPTSSPVADSRRAQLLEEAARLFGAKGYAHTSMRDIAAAFGILPGSLYHHFASKDALFVAVYAEGVDRIQAAVAAAVAGHAGNTSSAAARKKAWREFMSGIVGRRA